MPSTLRSTAPFLATIPRLMLACLTALLFAQPMQAASDQYKEEAVQVEHQNPAASAPQSTKTQAQGQQHRVQSKAKPTAAASASASASARQRGDNTMGAVALGTGLGGLLVMFIPFVGFLSLLLALTAIITGAIGIGRDARPGMAIGGMILGILVILLYIVIIVLIAAVLL